jgi:hypothetical protein
LQNLSCSVCEHKGNELLFQIMVQAREIS